MEIQMISWETLMKNKGRRDWLLIDLREKEEYEEEHFPGAIHQDQEELEGNIEQLFKKYQPNKIVLYCDRGNISLLLARDLGEMGYPVASLGGGYRKRKGREKY